MATYQKAQKAKKAGASSTVRGAKKKEIIEAITTSGAPRVEDYGMRLEDFEKKATLSSSVMTRVNLVQHRFSKKYYVLKIMKKSEVVRMRQVTHARSQRQMLQSLNLPFVVKMFKSYQDEHHVYLLLEYIIGGDLFTHMRAQMAATSVSALPANVTRQIAAEVVVALEALHELDIVYRNLSPENIVLDRLGHVKLVGFTFAKTLDRTRQTYTLCGASMAVAPEVIRSQGHGKAADWWALGVLVYELLAGFPPFVDDTREAVYELILSARVRFPSWFDADVRDFIKRLLVIDAAERMGTASGAEEVRAHKYFAGVKWKAVRERRVEPLLVPHIPGEPDAYGDTTNFEIVKDETLEDVGSGTEIDPFGDLFADF